MHLDMRWSGGGVVNAEPSLNLGFGGQDEEDFSWADYHGIGYLGSDARVPDSWLERKIRRRE